MKKLANTFPFIETETQSQPQFVSGVARVSLTTVQLRTLCVSLKLQEILKSYTPRKSIHHHDMQAMATILHHANQRLNPFLCLFQHKTTAESIQVLNYLNQAVHKRIVSTQSWCSSELKYEQVQILKNIIIRVDRFQENQQMLVFS